MAAVIAATLLLLVAGLVAWQSILVQAGRGTYGFSGPRSLIACVKRRGTPPA